MGWPKGVKRGPRQKKEVVPDSDERAATNSEQPASQPVTEVRASPHRESAKRPRLADLLAAQRGEKEKFSWKTNAGNLWELEGIDPRDDESVLGIPKEVYPPGVEFMWGTRSIRGQETPQILSGYKKNGWFEVHEDELSQWAPFEEYARDRWARDESGCIVYEACILLIQSKERYDRAVAARDRMAKQQLLIKEQAITGGNMNASGAADPSALGFNKIKRTVERIEIPKD